MIPYVLLLIIVTSTGTTTEFVEMPDRRTCEAGREIIVTADAEHRFPRLLTTSCVRKGPML